MMCNPYRKSGTVAIAASVMLGALPASAQYGLGVRADEGASNAARNAIPANLTDVTVTEHLNAQLPLDVRLRDSSGRAVRLGEYFTGRRPVLLNLAYYRCPMLCNLVSNAVVNGLRGVAWTPGTEFDVVTVSIDPRESAQDAAARRARIADQYGRASGANGWHFTVGEESEVRRLASALGFGYRYDARQNQYAHPAVVFLATPTGKVARYLYGISFNPNDLRFGLLEASEGRAISTVERVLLFCYHFDPQDRRYVLAAKQVMKLGGAVTAALLVGGLLALWLRELRRAREEAADAGGGVTRGRIETEGAGRA
jgi:protein SCO1/2